MNALPTWFEIPVLDMARAKVFYHRVFGWNCDEGADSGELWWALIQGQEGQEYLGALVVGPGYLPSATATLPYFASRDLASLLERVEPAGGRVLYGPDYAEGLGTYAHIMDTEGNRIGLVVNG